MKLQTHVVMTSINPPTDAMHAWSQNAPLIVVPDQKTPLAAYRSSGISLLDGRFDELMPSLPFNHYSRKNLGYLAAIEKGAEAIIDTDDDTWPAAGPLVIGDYREVSFVEIGNPDQPFLNVYARRLPDGPFPIWPRGLPLDTIHSAVHAREADSQRPLGVVQHLIDGDTDVDAVYRLVFGATDVHFSSVGVLEIAEPGSFFPSNSQLTCFLPLAFPLLYLPSGVSFRFTDILRGVVAKRILDQLGGAYALADPAGYQRRNPHDYNQDLVSEQSVYTGVRAAWEVLSPLTCSSAVNGLVLAYDLLAEAELVAPFEPAIVREWVGALEDTGC